MSLKIISAAVLLCLCTPALGQRLALSTNLAGYADGPGTMNVEASYGFSRHFSACASGRYNPFADDKQRAFAVGARWWPWHVYSGWWMAGKAQWQEFSSASDAPSGAALSGTSLEGNLSEGDRIGASLSAGYSRMLGKHFNLDLGLGVWGGYHKTLVYACPTCGRLQGSSDGLFVLPDGLVVALTYIF